METNYVNSYQDDADAVKSKDLVIQYDICVGSVEINNAEEIYIHSTHGFDPNDISGIKAYTQNKLDMMGKHLGKTISEFESKMNNLDANIQLRHTEIKPFQYKCNVLLAWPDLRGLVGALDAEKGERINNNLNKWISEHGYKSITSERKKLNDDFKIFANGHVATRFVKIGEFDATGYQTLVSFELGGFKLDGLEFVGMAAPYVDADKTGMGYADVKLVDKYASEMELIDYFKTMSSHLKCDGCNRTLSRDLYFIFKDDNGKFHYYGRNCANKVFGIEIVEKLKNFMLGLDNIGRLFAQRLNDMNADEEKLKKIIASMMKLDVLTDRQFDYKRVISAVGDDDFDDFFEKHSDEIDQKCRDFLTNSSAYFKSLDEYSSDFDAKIKAFGLGLTSGDSAVFRKIPTWIPPYAINKYFRYVLSNKATKELNGNFNVVPYGEFYGYKTFTGTVLDTVFNQKGYYIIRAKVSADNSPEEKYGIMWYDFSGNSLLLCSGDKIRATGAYSKYNKRGSNFTTIDKPKVEKINADVPQDDSHIGNDYGVGTRLRNQLVTVKKVFGGSMIVTTQDGFDFLIYIKNYHEDSDKFNINFIEGMKLRVTGTVQTNGNGRIYLNRCIINLAESKLRKNTVLLRENEIKAMVTECVKRILGLIN